MSPGTAFLCHQNIPGLLMSDWSALTEQRLGLVGMTARYSLLLSIMMLWLVLLPVTGTAMGLWGVWGVAGDSSSTEHGQADTAAGFLSEVQWLRKYKPIFGIHPLGFTGRL